MSKTTLFRSAKLPPEKPGKKVVEEALKGHLVFACPVGSRVTCNPPPLDTDEDWLALVEGEGFQEALIQAGFTQDGSPQFYTGNDKGGFQSWRLGEINVVTTCEREFFNKFMTATKLAQRFNLLKKEDRIALFQAVLYGVDWYNLES